MMNLKEIAFLREDPRREARIAAIKAQLGYFWYVGWLMMVSSFLLPWWVDHLTILYILRSRWEGWNEYGIISDINVLSCAIPLGLFAILAVAIWEVERKKAALITAMVLGVLQVIFLFFYFRPFELGQATISRFALPSVVIGLQWVGIIAIWIVGLKHAVIWNSVDKKGGRGGRDYAKQ